MRTNLHSGSGVEFLIYFTKSLVSYVSVDLRSADIAVAKHHLDGAKIRTIFEEMGRKAVPEQVRSNVANAGFFTKRNDYSPDRLSGKRAAAIRDE